MHRKVKGNNRKTGRSRVLRVTMMVLMGLGGAVLLLGLVVGYQAAWLNRGFGWTFVQCGYKSVASLEGYVKSGRKFNTFTEVMESAKDGTIGFFSSTFPTDKMDAHSYLPLYDRLAAPLLAAGAKAPLNVLEVGVKKGGFTKVIRELLPSSTWLFGIDVDPGVPQFPMDAHMKIMAGLSSHDCDAVRKALHGIMFDFVVDDGWHTQWGITTTYQCLRPLLKSSAVYVIEDVDKISVSAFLQNGIENIRIYKDKHPSEKFVVLLPKDSLAKQAFASDSDCLPWEEKYGILK